MRTPEDLIEGMVRSHAATVGASQGASAHCAVVLAIQAFADCGSLAEAYAVGRDFVDECLAQRRLARTPEFASA